MTSYYRRVCPLSVLLIFFASISCASFSFTWNTSMVTSGSSNASQITLPLVSSGMYDFVVDWGDGSNSTVSAWDSANKTHDYLAEGVYTVNISGTISGFSFNYDGDRDKITGIGQWAN